MNGLDGLSVVIDGSRIVAMKGFPKDTPLMYMEHGANAQISNCHLTGAGGPAFQFSDFDDHTNHEPN